jgi:hypothetical protein
MEAPSRRGIRSGPAEQSQVEGFRFGGRQNPELFAKELAAAVEDPEGLGAVSRRGEGERDPEGMIGPGEAGPKARLAASPPKQVRIPVRR